MNIIKQKENHISPYNILQPKALLLQVIIDEICSKAYKNRTLQKNVIFLI